ncbi:Glyoxylase, beta-lactamase superfamily II [Halopenitus malekzadehii]|uniref:Glyoxylase, beta-lactamase superfamily II n=1 Tax=Halopenitus malekzadehii TaxID=1267564 RepID=A0A1H6I294_9EURY|nr:MBL fold metallo-hydrolase [Halopenitus malekzadehii]SEH42625.1 Glyoxylase, beta-lactamase superfamily II [Halopenitus malekzadehii]
MIDEIAPDVYDVTVREHAGGRYRVFLFDGATPTLVDVGFADTVDRVTAATDELGIEPERVVITHGDGDHVGGLPGVIDAFDPEVWAPEGLVLEEAIDADLEATSDRRTDDGSGAGGNVRSIRRYGDGDTIGAFEAVATPGHTPTHHSLVDEDAGIAVLGDAVFGADARGLPEGSVVLPTAHYSADLNTADESLEKLLAFEFDVGLVYHGSSVLEDASETIDRFVNFAGKA